MKLYQISPLEWDGKTCGTEAFYTASTPFGQYAVSQDDDGSCRWSYCFDEYYDDGTTHCDSLEDAKRLAEEHWQQRLLSALTEYPPGGTPE